MTRAVIGITIVMGVAWASWAQAPKPPATATATATASASAPAPAMTPPSPTGVARALILAGLAGPDGPEAKTYARAMADWANRFQAVLTGKCGLKPQDVVVLSEAADAKASPPRAQATLANVRAAMERFAQAMGPNDQFVLVMLGQGQINEPVGKICLSGEDLKADELHQLLDKLPSQRTAIINCISGGAEFLKNYLTAGRVVITAAGAEQDGLQTYFAEFFLQGYEAGGADADKSGQIDLLEAYAYGAHQTANFYHNQYLVQEKQQKLKPGEPLTWIVRGKQTRAIWRRLYEGTSNQFAATEAMAKVMPKDAPPMPANLDEEADAEPKFGRFGPNWYNRRVLGEHARLDDTTDTKKSLFLWKPYEFEDLPKTVDPGAPTSLARTIVIGKPDYKPKAS